MRRGGGGSSRQLRVVIYNGRLLENKKGGDQIYINALPYIHKASYSPFPGIQKARKRGEEMSEAMMV